MLAGGDVLDGVSLNHKIERIKPPTRLIPFSMVLRSRLGLNEHTR